jgi:hypothetical protein
VDETQFAISQANAGTAEVRHLADIARATVCVLAGRVAEVAGTVSKAMHEGPRESRLLAWSVHAAVAQQSGPAAESRMLAAARRWAQRDGTPAARLALLGWQANSHYSQGRFMEAARQLVEIADAQRTKPWIQAEALVAAATIAVEAGDMRLAGRLSAIGRRIAARRRLARVEGNAEVARRKALYRAGSPLVADRQLVEILTGAGAATLSGVARVTEAAFAWRNGNCAEAVAIAMPQTLGPDPAKYSLIDLMRFSLAAAAGHAVSRSDALGAASAAASRCPPAIAAQVLALLVSASAAGPAGRETRRLAHDDARSSASTSAARCSVSEEKS